MKTRIINRLVLLTFLMTSCIAAFSQYQTEVPGDNFSLEGALELFKKSSSPEDFERMLNNPDAKVNNLDLNGDGYIDYIRVIDYQDGNVHAFVMQAVISKTEYQDIAVITLEKLANGKAILQITGDEDIYGVETIIEPTREVRTYGGTLSSSVYIDVWAWPIVRYVYGPYYTVWVSPWRWGYRPYWWYAWSPIVYYDYYSYWRPYHRYYSYCYTTRIVHAHEIYRSHRTTSVIVHNRHSGRVAHYRSNHIDRDGRYRSSNDRASRGRQNSSVRYNSNGRIASYDRASSRPSSNVRTQQNGTGDHQRSSSYNNRSSANRSSGNTQRYSTNSSTQRTTDRSSGSSSMRKSTENPGSYRSSGNVNTQRSTGNTNSQRYSERPSGNNNVQRSTGSSNMRKSTGNSGSYRSSGHTNVQRSTGSSHSRSSSGNSGFNRSPSRSSSGSGVHQSSGSAPSRSSGVQRSSSGRSSGSSSSHRSSGGSSRSSGSRHR